MSPKPVVLSAPCPCGRPRKFKQCCAPYHKGARPKSAEALMRSRYSAFAARNTRYLMATTHCSQAPQDRARWAQELRDFCQRTEFIGLQVHAAEERGNVGFVEFTAHLRQDGRDASFREHSLFERDQGRWLYLYGELGPIDNPVPKPPLRGQQSDC